MTAKIARGERIDHQETVRRSIGAAGRMDRLIRDVLTFARLGSTEIKLVPVDVEKLVRDILWERPELGASQNTVTIESPLRG